MLEVLLLSLKLRYHNLISSVNVFDFNLVSRLHHLEFFDTHIQVLQLALLLCESLSLSLTISSNGDKFLTEFCAYRLSLDDYLVLVLRL